MAKSNPFQFLQDVRSEASKVTWPSRKEVTNSTAVVVFTTLSMTVFFALMDVRCCDLSDLPALV